MRSTLDRLSHLPASLAAYSDVIRGSLTEEPLALGFSEEEQVAVIHEYILNAFPHEAILTFQDRKTALLAQSTPLYQATKDALLHACLAHWFVSRISAELYATPNTTVVAQ